MNRKLSCLFIVVVLLSAGCQREVPPTPAPTVAPKPEVTVTQAPTATVTVIPPTATAIPKTATKAPTPTKVPSPTSVPPTVTPTALPQGKLVSASWIQVDATTNKEIAKDVKNILSVNGFTLSGDLVTVQDPHTSPIVSISLPDSCLRGYQLVYTPPQGYLIRVITDGKERSDCGSLLTITASTANFSVRNPQSGGPVLYPGGTALSFKVGSKTVKAIAEPSKADPTRAGSWIVAFSAGIGQEIAFTFPGQGPICHRAWSISATPDYVVVYVWAEKDRNCKT